MRLPLFPMSVHLLPGGILPLRLFEPRYLHMLGLSQGLGFGLCLLGTRRSDGQMPLLALGTRVEVIDFNLLDDETLGITVRGVERWWSNGRQFESCCAADARLHPDDRNQA